MTAESSSPSSGFTWEKLHELLDAEEQQTTGADNNNQQQYKELQEKIHNVYQHHGMMTPLKGIWHRPIPFDLYTCPRSEPATTLVSLQSLPKATRDRLGLTAHGEEEDDDNKVVEVPTRLLQPPIDNDDTGTKTSSTQATLQQRPLGGNLSTKLTEYTRGMSGQCKPFRSGGMDLSETVTPNGATDNPFLTPEAMERAARPLKQGTKASWKDKSLLTAPPGIGIDVGLSYKDVFGEDADDGNEMDRTALQESSPDLIEETQNKASAENNAPIAAPVSSFWDKSFFDDDSLFGSSSESSQSESDSEEEDEEEGQSVDDEKGEEESSIVKGDDLDMETNNNDEVEPAAAEAETISVDDDDIDGLLAALTRAEAGKHEKLQPNVPDANNPLELAQKQALLQTNTTRKSWASTALLPIEDFHSLIPNPALTFPFQLDTFQQQAIARLERNESVFVAAHTSAGKTVVAEYACAMAKQRGTRCVYTSPIKALSNQKFRDFCIKFGAENVGLVTGDMQINVDDSTCLIMTTEILRSMLYRGADLIRDIEWVIFDEVHYVNDSERGVVWEEVIIMLPSYVNLVFLSATTPNTLEFSDWIGRTKRKIVHVIKTDYRPVPLSHHLWAGGKLHKLMQGKTGFNDKAYEEAANALLPQKVVDKKNENKKAGIKKQVPTSSRGGPKDMGWQTQGKKSQWISLVRYLEKESLTPAVIFSFSKKKCEEIAQMFQSLDLNTASERGAVQGFTLQTIARLSPNDAALPQVQAVCEMVKRGIGVHHGGLLPILKEMVEILFSRNLIKVLMSTETLAMGVNIQIRAVVFNSIRKHDGTEFRVLQAGEYTQMAGRAGRRGLDTVGTVIMCCFGEVPPPIAILKNMLMGQSTMLRSQFRLTYNMILNLLRVEEMSVENMIKRSFSEFATQRALTANEYPKLLAKGQKTLEKLEEQFKAKRSQMVGADDLEDYFSTCSELLASNRQLLSFVLEAGDNGVDNILQPGRLLLVSASRKHGVVHAPALVLKGPGSPNTGKAGLGMSTGKPDDSCVCMVLLPESYIMKEGTGASTKKAGSVGYVGSSKQRHYGVFEIKLENILLVSSTKKKIDTKVLYKETGGAASSAMSGFGGGAHANAFAGMAPRGGGGSFDNPFAGMKMKGKKNDDDLGYGKKASAVSSESDVVEKAMETLLEAEAQEKESGLAPMDLRDTVKRGSEVAVFRNHCQIMEETVVRMRSYNAHTHPNIEQYFTILERKRSLKEKVDALNHLLSNESLQLFPDFLQRKAVLSSMGYLDENEAVTVKGRVACEVNTCEELIATEMVFEGILNDLEPAEIVAALSSMVYQQKSDDEEFDKEMPETLLECCNRMKAIALDLGQVQKDHGLQIDPTEYANGALKFGLVHVVYEWALGVPFASICELTDVQEGSIVRCITRLDELCREIRNCARVVGNPTLYRKMEAASIAIKRDIVFTSSLYVS